MNEAERLAQQLYEWAAALPRRRWYTTRLRDLESLVATRDPEGLARLRAAVEGSWDRYYAQPLAYEERTAETVAGHRLLVEGLAGWLKALDLLAAGAPGPDVLALGEAANRLLVAVQDQARKLQKKS